MSKPRYQYQEDLSLQSPILLDGTYKRAKVDKMLAILRDTGAIGAASAGIAVDIGCSRGFFARGLASHFDHVIGMDIDPHALRLAASENPCSNLSYARGDSMRLPLPDDSVDLVVCNHVYEHVPDAPRLFQEIRRVLRPGGRCYLGAASRLTLVEPHYHLPFLSWLPKPLAHLYMRLAGKGSHYYENLCTYWGIKALVGGFSCEDYTLKVIEAPDRYCARELLPKDGLLARLPLAMWKLFYPLLPTYILILRKSEDRNA